MFSAVVEKSQMIYMEVEAKDLHEAKKIAIENSKNSNNWNNPVYKIINVENVKE